MDTFNLLILPERFTCTDNTGVRITNIVHSFKAGRPFYSMVSIVIGGSIYHRTIYHISGGVEWCSISGAAVRYIKKGQPFFDFFEHKFNYCLSNCLQKEV